MKQPRNPFHPGAILQEEFLEPAGMTQTVLADRLGWTRTRLNEPVRGKRGITATPRWTWRTLSVPRQRCG